MSRLSTLTATALAVLAAAPAAALAGETELRGAPQLRVVDADTVRVSFVNDDKATKGRVVIADHGTATRSRPTAATATTSSTSRPCSCARP
jgi:hypothetical protein